jgi:hypothetical protein
MLIKFIFGPSKAQRRHDELCAELQLLRFTLFKLELSLMSALDDLKAKVAYQGDVVSSVVTLIKGFNDQLAAAAANLASKGVDVTELEKLGAQVDANTAALAEAVAYNTVAEAPAQPTPVEAPVEAAPEVAVEDPVEAPVAEEAPVEAPVEAPAEEPQA